MKTFFTLLAACLAVFAQTASAAQTADTRLYCESVRFSRGNGPYGLYFMDLTGIQNGINGELFPVFGQNYNHYTYLVMSDESDMQTPGVMYLNVPSADKNGNGFNDFFESAQSFTGTSSGIYLFPASYNGSVTATWSRGAGSYSGTCKLNFQYLGEFTHTFTILEYKGPITYTPGASQVSANVELMLNSDSGNKLSGPIAFNKSAGNPHNILTNQPGAWVNSASEKLFFGSQLLTRDTSLKTNYYGYLLFEDGDLSTSETDYDVWVLSIDDLNDANHNGIPDFSDEPAVVVVPPPTLKLNLAPPNALITINGEIGQVCDIQEAPGIDAATWPTILSVTLTNTSQTVTLPLPSSNTRFWRVQAH